MITAVPRAGRSLRARGAYLSRPGHPARWPRPATRGDLLGAAIASRTRPEVLTVLRMLSDGEFRQVRDLWRELADVPISG